MSLLSSPINRGLSSIHSGCDTETQESSMHGCRLKPRQLMIVRLTTVGQQASLSNNCTFNSDLAPG